MGGIVGLQRALCGLAVTPCCPRGVGDGVRVDGVGLLCGDSRREEGGGCQGGFGVGGLHYGGVRFRDVRFCNMRYLVRVGCEEEEASNDGFRNATCVLLNIPSECRKCSNHRSMTRWGAQQGKAENKQWTGYQGRYTEPEPLARWV